MSFWAPWWAPRRAEARYRKAVHGHDRTTAEVGGLARGDAVAFEASAGWRSACGTRPRLGPE